MTLGWEKSDLGWGKSDLGPRSSFQGHNFRRVQRITFSNVINIGKNELCLRSLFPEKVTLGKVTFFQGHNDLAKNDLRQRS